MKEAKLSVLILAVSLIVLNNSLNFAQEPAGQSEAQKPVSEDEAQWLWGEVSFVDSQKGEILVKYLDYETDTDKEAVIKVDDKTAYENSKALYDIKPLDKVSIDYIVEPDGANIAKSISVEKPEDTQIPLEGGVTEDAPEPTSSPAPAVP